MEEFEYVIIGQGSAAFAAAIKANDLGVKTAMVGNNATPGAQLGGTCVNVGCVPSKRMITVAAFLHEIRQNRFAGIDAKIGSIKYKEVVDEKDRLVEKFRAEKYKDVLGGLENVSYIGEFGSFIDKGTIKAGKRELQAKYVLLAPGARAQIPKVKGVEGAKYLTNEEALSLKELPESMIVVGGRALGLEFAQMFSRFGTKVTVLQRSERILPNWEPEISTHLQRYLEEEGIKVITNAAVKEVSGSSGTKSVSIEIAGKPAIFEAEQLLFATGRMPNVEKLNLHAAGVELDDKGFIKIDTKMKTSAKGIYAAGDVTGQPMLETLAAKEGSVATANIFENAGKEINLNEVPNAVFTDPEAAMVGSVEEDLIKNGIRCACNPIPFEFVPKASIIGNTKGVIKILIDGKTKVIRGVHILAPHAADLIHEGVLAVKYKLTIDDIIDTVHVFPTLSESMKLASQAFYKDLGGLSCCTE